MLDIHVQVILAILVILVYISYISCTNYTRCTSYISWDSCIVISLNYIYKHRNLCAIISEENGSHFNKK